LKRIRECAPPRARNCFRRRQNAMRGVLMSITNIVGHAHPRSPSLSSSDSDVQDDGNEDLRPVGARIGHNFRKRQPQLRRSDYPHVRSRRKNPSHRLGGAPPSSTSHERLNIIIDLLEVLLVLLLVIQIEVSLRVFVLVVIIAR